MISGPITSWQKAGETVTDFVFLGSKITVDGDCNHEIKRYLLLGRKAMTKKDSILKSRDITLPTTVHLIKAMVFPVVMYGCESWTVKKAELWRMDAFFLFSDFLLFLNFTILYWFCHISKWIRHRHTRVPHPEPSSLLPPHTLPLGRPSAPAPSIHYRALNLDWWLVSYIILYMFQCQ